MQMPEWKGRMEKEWRERRRMTNKHTLPKEMKAKAAVRHLYTKTSDAVVATSVTHAASPVEGTAWPTQGKQL